MTPANVSREAVLALPRKCPACAGRGWHSVAEHAQDQSCYEGNHNNCPVEAQEQCDCRGHLFDAIAALPPAPAPMGSREEIAADLYYAMYKHADRKKLTNDELGRLLHAAADAILAKWGAR